MTSRFHFVLLISASLLCTSASAFAFQSDPYGGNSPPGTSSVLGIPLKEPDTPPDRVTGQAEGGKQIEFKSQTTLVRVPVVVTDSSGGHLHQLSKSDFKVLEDGKPQTIASFDEIIPDNSVRAATPPSSNTFTNMTSDVSKANSVVVMLIDKVNTPFLSQADARRQLIKYLADHLNSSQPMALMAITGKGLRVLSPFGTDPKVLMAALKNVSGEVAPKEQFSDDSQIIVADGEQPIGLAAPIGINESPDHVIRRFTLAEDSVQGAVTQQRTIETTLRAFLQMAWSLSGVPGRKSVIWVTGSFPFYLENYTSVPGDPTLRALYERVLKAFADAQISVYPVDARGLLTDSAYAGTSGVSFFGPDASSQLDQSTFDSLKVFAKMTGGVAYYQTNDLAGAVDHAVEDSSSYYLITYYLDRRNNKPGWRQLQVQVSRKDAKVRARAGFLVTNLAVNPELSHKADVDFALASPYESTGVRITEHWLGVAPSGDKKKVGFVVNVPAQDLIDESDKNRFDVEFIAQAERKGVAAGSVGQTIKGSAAPENLAKLKADGVLYRNSLELSPGDYQVRFIVRDNLTGRLGSVIVPLTVN
jgi:VWFA-related protein